MPPLTIVEKNLFFLVMEVTKQVERTRALLDQPEASMRRRIQQRDDYIDHLKGLIENKLFDFLGRHGDLSKTETNLLRSMNVVASNLERLADHTVDITRQMTHFSDPRFFHRYDYAPFFECTVEALGQVLPAVLERDARLAVEICHAEAHLDELYRQKFERVLAEMALGRDVPDLVTSLFVFHYLERMGDCLLNIGEAIIFAKVGDRLKFHQFESLRGAMTAVRAEDPAYGDSTFEGIWGTRSGMHIGKIADVPEEDGRSGGVIYKEGNREKILKEKESIARWSAIDPSLPPRLVELRDTEVGAALMVEFLEGQTIQELLMNGEAALLGHANRALEETLRRVWTQTRQDRPCRADFLGQLMARMDDVTRMHPGVANRQRQIGGLVIPDLPSLIHRHRGLDEVLCAPFSVFCHGDFNVDNIIFDPSRARIHFIDLHRSREMDYVADVAVFLVSIFRLPMPEPLQQELANQSLWRHYQFAQGFARDTGDTTFEARLALGLVRSFTTSTRFEVDPDFAEDMFQRAQYLMERLDQHGTSPWDTFVLPADVLMG